MRELIAALIVPILIVTNYRFSKEWRQSETGFKAWGFKHLNTTQANIWANAHQKYVVIVLIASLTLIGK